MVKRSSSDFVGLSHHPSVNNQGNAFQFGIWIKCHDTSRDPRELSFVIEESNEGKKVNLDLLDEVRERL